MASSKVYAAPILSKVATPEYFANHAATFGRKCRACKGKMPNDAPVSDLWCAKCKRLDALKERRAP
jgi:hypothetical protein